MSKLKTGKVNAIRFPTLNSICKALDCTPGDILEYVPDAEDEAASGTRLIFKKHYTQILLSNKLKFTI